MIDVAKLRENFSERSSANAQARFSRLSLRNHLRIAMKTRKTTLLRKLAVAGVPLALAAAFLLPSSVQAEIVERGLGTTASGEQVSGYVYQAGRKRTTSRQSRLGPRVSSGGRYRYGNGIPAGYVIGTGGVAGYWYFSSRGWAYGGVGFCRSAGLALAPLGVRACDAGGRVSIRLGF